MPSRPVLRLECFCGRTYTNPIDLEEHRGARGHFPSHVCTSSCEHSLPLDSPFEPSRCSTCDKLCLRPDILLDHRIFTGHCFCADCDRPFPSQEALQLHHDSEIHASEFRCCDCDSSFKDIHALNAHVRSHDHEEPEPEEVVKNNVTPPSNESIYEQPKQTYQISEDTQQHETPAKYDPPSTLACPLSTKCRKDFLSTAGLLNHFESGNCKSGISRQYIQRIVQMCDYDYLIHDPAVPQRHVLLGRMIRGADIPRRCPSCPGKTRLFATTHALRDHLNSSVHRTSFYCCPADSRKFSTLSGLAQHLESGACKDAKRTVSYCVDILQGHFEELGYGGLRFLLEEM